LEEEEGEEMKKSVIWAAQTVLVVAALAQGAVHAQPAEPAQTGNRPEKAKSSKKAAKPPARVSKVKFMPGSEETVSQRVARLKRECKGAVNAGACEGYTR
jgi:hypothetical protein